MKNTILILATAFLMPLAPAEKSQATLLLEQRSEHLKPQIIQVSPSVYTATGYSPANVSAIVGPEGLVIIDTGMFAQHAETILAEFRKVSDLPIKGIILTHGHGDHTGGLPVFQNEGDEKPELYARGPFNTEGEHFHDGGITINKRRGALQAGFPLPPEKRINNGIANAIYPSQGRQSLRWRFD